MNTAPRWQLIRLQNSFHLISLGYIEVIAHVTHILTQFQHLGQDVTSWEAAGKVDKLGLVCSGAKVNTDPVIPMFQW